jgi:hypothetical protein
VSNKTVVSSPPRSGNNFLQFMINHYINTNRLDYEPCDFGQHDPKILLDTRYSSSITVLRDPKDVFISALVFNYERQGFDEIEKSFDFFKKNYMHFFVNLRISDHAHYVLFDDLIKNVNSIIYKIFYPLDNSCPEPKLKFDEFSNGSHPLKTNVYKSPVFSKDSNKELRNQFLSKIGDFSFDDIKQETSKLLSDHPEKRLQ